MIPVDVLVPAVRHDLLQNLPAALDQAVPPGVGVVHLPDYILRDNHWIFGTAKYRPNRIVTVLGKKSHYKQLSLYLMIFSKGMSFLVPKKLLL